MSKEKPRVRIVFDGGNIKIFARSRGDYYVLEIPAKGLQKWTMIQKLATYTQKHGKEEFLELLLNFVKIFGRPVSTWQFYEEKAEVELK